MENASKETKKTQLLGVNLPISTLREIDALAEEQGLMRGRSQIARVAIREYLQRHGKKQHSVQEAA